MKRTSGGIGMENRNASASALGWDFQANAAIMLMLENIQKAEKVRVEGKDEENVRRLASWLWLDSDLS